jgi:hypothetical protein
MLPENIFHRLTKYLDKVLDILMQIKLTMKKNDNVILFNITR